MDNPGNAKRVIEPEFLGPLTDGPPAPGPPSGGGKDLLFPGASTFLSPMRQRRRLRQWDAARPLAERLLQADEHVLHVAHAIQMPSILHYLSLGAMAMAYHQVVLVLTDRRVIEVLLGVRGVKAETRVRTFPWASVRQVKQSLGKLTIVCAKGGKQTWKVPLRGDRRLVSLLIPRLTPLCLSAGEGMAETLPLWHCPRCAATVPAGPRRCDACGAVFRSTRTAMLLSLAFPGAGLLYVGHPFLAFADFLGEVFLYAVFLMLALQAGPGTAAATIGVGVFFFVLTKLESVHLSRILASRCRLETPARLSAFNRFALVGGLTSVLLVGGALPLIGAARPVVDRDLDVVGEDSVWQGSRNAADWVAFADDPATRSQWTHPSGVRLTLFAYPQGLLESPEQFRNDARRGLVQQRQRILKDDTDLPAPFHGFRFVVATKTEDGEPLSMVHDFIVDEENHDIHHLLSAVIEEDGAAAEELADDLLAHARWIPPTPPERPERTAEVHPQ